MPSGGWRGYRALLTKTHDGDTFWVLADTGFDQRHEPGLRLADVSAPEIPRAMALPPRRQPGGGETTEFVNGWLAAARDEALARRWYLSVGVAMTTTPEPSERTSFRRFVAVVYRYQVWPRPWEMPMPPLDWSLNAAAGAFLAEHPEWPSGE